LKILIFGLPGSGKTTLATPFAELIGGVHLNADAVRAEYNDWDFTLEGRNRQASRMKYLADGVVKAGKIAVADFVCPTHLTRLEFQPDYTVWMDTISVGDYPDTNAMFQKPDHVDYHIERWFNDAHQQLMPVVQRWMEIKNV
jgi:adenylylsulfate kinase